MAHGIETAAYAVNPAWHGLGTVVDHAMSVDEALNIAGLNWPVGLHEISLLGQQESIERFRATVRETDSKVLGVVSDRYRVVQNTEAFAFVDELLGQGVKFESAGSLFGGTKIFILARMPESIKIAGDEIIPYLVFTNGHDGKHAVKVALTPTRVVCWNTLQLALQTTKRMWETTHVGDLAVKMEEAKLTLQMAEAYLEEMPVVAEEMIAANIYDDEVKKIIEALFPYPLTATERVMEGKDKLRNSMWNLYVGKPDLQKFRGTQWGVYNAAADMVSHWEARRETSTFKERLFGKVIEGHPVLVKTGQLLGARRKVKA